MRILSMKGIRLLSAYVLPEVPASGEDRMTAVMPGGMQEGAN